LNRDVRGGEFAYKYGIFFVLYCFAIGIILELIAVTVLSDYKRDFGLGGLLLFSSLFGGIANGLISMVRCLP
jgi:hypothetical protein